MLNIRTARNKVIKICLDAGLKRKITAISEKIAKVLYKKHFKGECVMSAKIIGNINNTSIIKKWQKREEARLHQVERDKLAKYPLYRAIVKVQQKD